MNDHSADFSRGDTEAVVVRQWKLTEEEIGDLRSVLGDKALKSPVIEISRRYISKPAWKFEIDTKTGCCVPAQ